MELRCVLVAAALLACGPSAKPSSEVPAPSASDPRRPLPLPTAPPELSYPDHLPAGLYWEGYRTCRACPQKVWLVARAAANAEAAKKARDAASALDLPLGYPVVEHGARIQMDEKQQESLWVIYGIVASEEKAVAFFRELRDHKIESEILAVPQEDAGHSHQIAVTMMPGKGTVPAYRAEDVQVPRSGPLELYFTGDPKAARATLQSKTPVCQIPRDAVFTPPRKALEWYRWVPVYCGEELAFVDWRETRMMSSFFRDKDGSRRMRQVVLVECDVPTILEWPVSEQGHKTGPGKEVLRTDGC